MKTEKEKQSLQTRQIKQENDVQDYEIQQLKETRGKALGDIIRLLVGNSLLTDEAGDMSEESSSCSLCSSLDSALGDEHNIMEEYQTQTAHVHPHDHPIFNKNWQGCSTFSSAGGTLRLPNSHISLEVPQGAIQDTNIQIQAAVCADVSHIRSIISLPDNEEISSPLIEYKTDPYPFRFTKRVAITLPHFLPEDYDVDMVRVYRISADNDGALHLSKIRCQSVSKATMRPPDSPVEAVSRHDFSSEGKHQHEVGETEDRKAQTDLQSASHRQNIVWDEQADFEILPNDQLLLTVDGFSGYVCTYCHKKTKKSPQLYAVAHGSFKTERDISAEVTIWDRRLKNNEFRQKEGIHTLEPAAALLLMQNIEQTSLLVRMRLTEGRRVEYTLDEDGNVLSSREKRVHLSRLLGCSTCVKKGKMDPMTFRWSLTTPAAVDIQQSIHVAMQIEHIDPSQPAEEADPQLVTTDVHLWVQRSETVARVLQGLELGQLERIAREAGVADDVLNGNRSSSVHTEQLIRSCLSPTTNQIRLQDAVISVLLENPSSPEPQAVARNPTTVTTPSSLDVDMRFPVRCEDCNAGAEAGSVGYIDERQHADLSATQLGRAATGGEPGPVPENNQAGRVENPSAVLMDNLKTV